MMEYGGEVHVSGADSSHGLQLAPRVVPARPPSPSVPETGDFLASDHGRTGKPEVILVSKRRGVWSRHGVGISPYSPPPPVLTES